MPYFRDHPEILIPFLKATGDHDPHEDTVLAYVAEHATDREEKMALLAWAFHQLEGLTETDVCTGCWAIVIRDTNNPEAEGLHFNACDNCQGTICQFCHNDEDEDEDHRCLCGKCTVPVGYTDDF